MVKPGLKATGSTPEPSHGQKQQICAGVREMTGSRKMRQADRKWRQGLFSAEPLEVQRRCIQLATWLISEEEMWPQKSWGSCGVGPIPVTSCSGHGYLDKLVSWHSLIIPTMKKCNELDPSLHFAFKFSLKETGSQSSFAHVAFDKWHPAGDFSEGQILSLSKSIA